VDSLVACLFDRTRAKPVVVMTTGAGDERPLIDADAVAAAVAPPWRQRAPDPHRTPDPGADRAAGRPPRVFGGRARIWWPREYAAAIRKLMGTPLLLLILRGPSPMSVTGERRISEG
jgi:hypothetical protein